MGNSQSYCSKITYEDVQHILNNNTNFLIISTLEENYQSCLLPNTIHINHEAKVINDLIEHDRLDTNILIYGMNCNDDKVYNQQKKLFSLGFKNVYIYLGGLFEWLCLQDIYGREAFPTSSDELDILRYKPSSVMNKYLITYKN
jgi:hypothetical protein